MGLGDYIMYSNTERNFEVGNIIVKMVKLLAWPTLTAQLNLNYVKGLITQEEIFICLETKELK